MTPMWTLDEAQKLISKMQDFDLKCDYNLALGGAVLNEGESYKDLDILLIPRSSKREPNWNKFLTKFTTEPRLIGTYENSEVSIEGRFIYRFQTDDGKMIDLIFIDFMGGK